jgi:hypothetical protein
LVANGTRVIRGAATLRVAIGCIADIGRHGREMARSLMTQSGHRTRDSELATSARCLNSPLLLLV